MSVGISFTLCSFFFILLLTIVYFSKQRVKTEENTIYSYLVITSLFGTSIGVPCYYFMKEYEKFTIPNLITSKGYLVYLVIWISLFSFYILSISFKNIKLNRFKKLFEILCVVFSIMVCILPLYYENSNEIVYSYGPATNFMYLISAVAILIILFSAVTNIKQLTQKRFVPVIAFIIIGTAIMIIQKINPGLLLITFGEAFITFMMYFTIENPDVQMMEELYRNKKLIEKSSEDTSNFLFRMTQDIKKPIQDIIDVSHDMYEIDDIKEIKDGAKIVNNKAKELDYFVNDALDVSSMSTKTIKIFNTRYNPRTLFNETKYIAENSINKNVKFEFNVASTLPSYLYGDSIKLKQAISSIIDNSVKNTTSGFISLNVDAIIKYDICRLLITVSDSGNGMDIEEVNDILSLNIDDLSKVKLSDDKKLYNLKEIKKLTMVLGGNLIVKSELGKGTTVSITFDQKVVENNKLDISKKLDLYEQSLHSNLKVMVVDDDAKELARITSILENMDAHVSGSLFGRDVIDKISNRHKFDLIILDDETSTYSGLEVLKELKKNPKFNIPVVIMINDGKEFIKLQYLKDGFSDVILKSKLKSELGRVVSKF